MVTPSHIKADYGIIVMLVELSVLSEVRLGSCRKMKCMEIFPRAANWWYGLVFSSVLQICLVAFSCCSGV